MKEGLVKREVRLTTRRQRMLAESRGRRERTVAFAPNVASTVNPTFAFQS